MLKIYLICGLVFTVLSMAAEIWGRNDYDNGGRETLGDTGKAVFGMMFDELRKFGFGKTILAVIVRTLIWPICLIASIWIFLAVYHEDNKSS